jgi:DNA-binding MarR family transcriptional regulator
MSSKDPPNRRIADHGPPYVGALLRLAWQVCRRRMLDALRAEGFKDLNDAYLNVLQYPPPDGVRPLDLAAQKSMSKQALNYLLAQLEDLGYLERRAENGIGRRVFLTAKGWNAYETMWRTMRGVEAEWRARVGRRGFEQFRSTLRALAADAEDRVPFPASGD